MVCFKNKKKHTGVLLLCSRKPGFVFLFQENKVLFVCFKNNKGCRSSSEEPLAEEPLAEEPLKGLPLRKNRCFLFNKKPGVLLFKKTRTLCRC